METRFLLLFPESDLEQKKFDDALNNKLRNEFTSLNVCVLNLEDFLEFEPSEKENFFALLKKQQINTIVFKQSTEFEFSLKFIMDTKNQNKEAAENEARQKNIPLLVKENYHFFGNPGNGWQWKKIKSTYINEITNNKTKNLDKIEISGLQAKTLSPFHLNLKPYLDVKNKLENEFKEENISNQPLIAPFLIKDESEIQHGPQYEEQISNTLQVRFANYTQQTNIFLYEHGSLTQLSESICESKSTTFEIKSITEEYLNNKTIDDLEDIKRQTHQELNKIRFTKIGYARKLKILLEREKSLSDEHYFKYTITKLQEDINTTDNLIKILEVNIGLLESRISLIKNTEIIKTDTNSELESKILDPELQPISEEKMAQLANRDSIVSRRLKKTYENTTLRSQNDIDTFIQKRKKYGADADGLIQKKIKEREQNSKTNQKEIEAIILFLEYNIDFFLMAFQNTKIFSLWVLDNNTDAAINLSNALMMALELEIKQPNADEQKQESGDSKKYLYVSFYDALIKLAAKSDSSYLENRKSMIKVLNENQNLRAVLKANHENPAIDQWYADRPYRWYEEYNPNHPIIKFLWQITKLNNSEMNSEMRGLNSCLHNIYLAKHLTYEEIITSLQQAVVDTYWKIRENRFLGISKTADALEEILNSEGGLNLPAYGETFRVPHDVTGHIKPVIREYIATVTTTTCVNGKNETKVMTGLIDLLVSAGDNIETIKTNCKAAEVKLFKENNINTPENQLPDIKIDIKVLDIRERQNKNFMAEARELIESRKTKAYEANKNYIDECRNTLDNECDLENETQIELNKFKMQLILEDFVNQGLLGKQNTTILNKNELEENKEKFPFDYVIQQLKIVLARTKTHNDLAKLSLESEIKNQYIAFHKYAKNKQIKAEELLDFLNNLQITLSNACTSARTDAKIRDNDRFPYLCFFPFHGQSILGDALEKFNKDVISKMIRELEEKNPELKKQNNRENASDLLSLTNTNKTMK